MKRTTVHYFVISAFTILYAITSLISTVHVVDFFKLTNPDWLAISLAIAFEVGAAASLASIIALDKMNKFIVWMLFIILTLMQAMGNTYYAYVHAAKFQSWIELFGLIEEDIIYQKRILSLLSGGILPIVALGYIKALIDYIRPSDSETTEPVSIPVSIPDKTEIAEPVSLPEPNSMKNEELTTSTSTEPITTKPAETTTTTVFQPTTNPPTTTKKPEVNNIEPSHHEEMSIDDKLARGKNVDYSSNLKKPHDP